ncbi:hypothetical protein SAMN04489737_0315 [Arcanobacterium phocae]|uniref:Uncharacterized protein n=1 Tax=Arcanobacterium phocae TaxID=131112 RepID=A0A1H2LBI2_9ACTO|nr:hypothetical protein SAMN04489737_0315 [Arcanobacterium phocae]
MVSEFGLEIVCVERVMVECARLQYRAVHPVLGQWWFARLGAGRLNFDEVKVQGLFDEVLDALRAGDRFRARKNLRYVRIFLSDAVFSEVDPRSYVDMLIYALELDDEVLRRRCLSALWFEMVHDWRGKRDMGVPSAPDLSKFMLVEWVLTLVLSVIGVVVPTCQAESWFKVVPAVTFALLCLYYATLVRLPNVVWNVVMFWVGFGVTLPIALALRDYVSPWIIWSWSGGALVGFLIGNHRGYQFVQRTVAKYGPFACLWARVIGRNRYEIVMVGIDGRVFWHHVISGWYRHIYPLLGANLSASFRSAVLHRGAVGAPFGGWYQCYPALVSTRMVGLRRWNPTDWDDARKKTAGLTSELIDQFFSNPASVLAPPVAVFPSDTPSTIGTFCFKW